MKSDDKVLRLDKFLDLMQGIPESIYYTFGDSVETMKKLPSLQIFEKSDLEVLMLLDHLDEPCIQKLADHEGKQFVLIPEADVKLDETEDEKKCFAKLKGKLTEPMGNGAMKDAGAKIEKVEVSKRLTEVEQEKVMKTRTIQSKDQKPADVHIGGGRARKLSKGYFIELTKTVYNIDSRVLAWRSLFSSMVAGYVHGQVGQRPVATLSLRRIACISGQRCI